MPTSRRAAKAEAEAPESAAPAAVSAPVSEYIGAVVAQATDLAPASSSSPALASSKLPPLVQFPLAVTLSFALASIGYNLLGEVSKGDLAAVSRSQDTWGEVGILAGWRLFELALGWFGMYDSIDIAALGVLSHGPSLYLLTAFYNLKPATAISALVIDIASAAIPFFLLRPLAPLHKPSAARLPNRELADWATQLYTTALSGAIYAVVVVLSLRTLLPRVLVLEFASLPSLTPAYEASYATVLPVALTFGLAASNFIFAPFATTGPVAEDDDIDRFDPAAATLGQTVRWNLCGYTAKTKVAVGRTAAAALATAGNTVLACILTIHGITASGATAYAAVWVAAVVLSGLGLGIVGGE